MSDEHGSIWFAPAGPPHANELMLRDVFATAALVGLLSDPELEGSFEEFAQGAYRYADAMLTERQKQG